MKIKIILFVLATVLSSINGFSRDVVFDVTVNPGGISYDESGNMTYGDQSITLDGVTIASPAIRWDQQYRIYKDRNLTISSPKAVISKIQIECTANGTDNYGPGGFEAFDGYSYADEIGTWVGESNTVIFFASNTVRATKIIVTVHDPVIINGICYDLRESGAIVRSNELVKYEGDIVIPKSVDYGGKTYVVKSIGDEAFYSCRKLTSITIPESVTNIGYHAFDFCNNLTAVNILDLAAWCKIDFENYPSNPLRYAHHLYLNGEEIKNLIVPESVSEIKHYAFYNCSSLSSITISNSVTRIGNEAFEGCKSLTNVTIPEGVTSIGHYAFVGCSNIDRFFFNSSTPPTIGEFSFDTIGLWAGTDAVFFVPDDAVASYKSDWLYSYSTQIYKKSGLDFVANLTAADGHSELLKSIGGVGKEEEVIGLKVIGSINGYDIMLMRNKMTNLHFLDLSDATIVPEKDNYEYYTGYYTQENVLGDYCFYNVDNLRSVVLPKNITSIGKYAFANCDNLVTVTGMPECCATLGDYVFYKTPKLKEVYIGTEITSIPSRCFYQSGISSITLPDKLENIGTYAFYYCTNLRNIKLPPSLKTIESNAFRDCSSLAEIHVPSMLESIADNVFTGCTNVRDVYVYTLTPTSIQQNSFVYDGVTLHAPQEPEDVFWGYYNNTQWSQFTNVVPFEAKYEKWYTGEDQDITLGDGETIPNEDEDEKAEGEMRPGSCLEYLQGAFQWLDKLIMKWTGGKFPCLIDNSSVFIDELTFHLEVKAGKWYFFSFPFDIDLSQCTFPSNKYVWRYYDGDIRAKNGGGAWTNVTDGKLKAFQGYIFQTNTNGNIQITVTDPMFTGSNKRVNIAAHASSQPQNAGWNFVGNPFTSYYDLGNFIDEFDCPITVWDPVNNTYNAIVPGDDDYEFHPFEAFFVQKPEGQSNITFSKDGREGYNDAMRTLQSRRRARAAQAINPKRRIVNLEITDGSTTDKTRVVFNDERQMKYEPECDASKFMSEESAVQLFTIGNNDIRYAINERPNADPSTGSGQAQCIVRLGFTAAADGNYTISAPRMDKPMALKDLETGMIHNFADGDYEFLAKAGTHMDRFVLMPEQFPTSLSSLLAEGIKLEAQDGGINIAGIEGKTASIYNAAGQLVATLTESGRTEVTPGAYVVKVGEVSTKIVVR